MAHVGSNLASSSTLHSRRLSSLTERSGRATCQVQQLQPTVTSVEDLLRNGGDFVRIMQDYAEALRRGSGNGGVSAIVDEIPYLKIFLSNYCEGYTMVGPTYRLGGFGFAIFSLATQEMEWIEKKWFGDPGVCLSKSNNIHLSSLNFSSFSGLFVISGTVSGLVFLVHLTIYAPQA